MISLEKMRELEPKLADKTDEEVAKIRDEIYELAQIAFDSWMEKKKS